MTATFPKKISPILMTPDPHYIPGYSGFCPQYKYNLGRTYGKLTSQLLTCPDIHHSGQLVLQSCPFPPPRINRDLPETPTRRRRLRSGDQKLNWSMIPGYTGFIPKSQNFFSKTYTETSKDALGDFQKDQQRQEAQRQEQTLATKLQNGQQQPQTEREKQLLRSKYRTPLPALSKEPALYCSQTPFESQMSPYYMDEENPNKYFISGYMGYVPRSRFLIGTGYPVTTNRAMVEFERMNSKKDIRPSASQEPQKNGLQPDQSHIYLEELGLLPRYTGYVPGYKFQFGHTYGQLTQDALGQSTLQKQVLD
ncbi:protein FAM166B [Spea bombifrons]|uniref:protein FAM166B n=1 Tax=Spea bombifrons TaxID=233779 RepID=UPI002348F526|nr:protein FAM166B [Spea bombifrons]